MTYTLMNNMNIECTIRLIIAALCGALIGIERSKRNKGAGVRTHMIVAMGAALFVIVSQFGFSDVINQEYVQVDVARVASNVVTGVSFLGAGIIFMRGDSVKGLTTAAGIWVTAAVGLAIGCGMYLTGCFVAVLVLIVQELLHIGLIKGMEGNISSQIIVSMEDDPESYKELEKNLSSRNITIVDSHILRSKDGSMTYTLDVKIPRDLTTRDVLYLIKDIKNVKSIGI